MTSPPPLRRFLSELKRRNVYKVAASYLVAAFVVVQVADLATGAFGLPGWFEPMVWVACGLGLPIALVLAWAYDLGPGGLRRTDDEDSAEAAIDSSAGGRTIRNAAWLGLLAVGAVGGWLLLGTGSSDVTDRSIAVLPFETSGGEESLQFSRGLHDGLLTRLTNVAALTVKSRTSTQRYRGADLAIPDIAAELDVAWIVEGAVFLVGDEVRVNATLIDAQGDERRWSRDYERRLTIKNIFDIQSDLAQEIARSLETEVSARERERLAKRPTDDLEAYRLYIQGRTRLEQRTETALRQAVQHFEAAAERDREFAEAWSGLAEARVLLATFSYDRSDTLPSRAYDAAVRAVALDPDLAEAHTSLGLLLDLYRRDAPAAHAELTRAMELNPNYSPATYWLSILETQRGRLRESLTLLERAAELDPHSPNLHNVLGLMYWAVAGRDSVALAHFEESRRLDPGFALPHVNEGLLLSEMGRHPTALEAVRRGRDLTTPGTLNWGAATGVLSVVRARSGDMPGARETLDELRDAGGFQLWEAMALAALGETDEAFRALGEVEWTAYLQWDLQVYPGLEPLREDPRYRQLVREVNVLWGLDPDGSLPR